MEQIKMSTGETLYKKGLPNGLTAFVLPKAKFLRTYGVLSTHYGSLDSKFQVQNEGVREVPPGIAHFLEHKLFEEEEGNVFGRFAAWGASVNAFTSYNQTSYLFSTIDSWQDCLVQLIDFVNNPYLTAENVDKEKGIIEQELQMYADDPDHRLHSTLLESLYHKHPVRLDIGGTVESVRAITVEDLLRCYYTFYQPSNMALAVVGDVDPKETIELIERSYPKWQHQVGPIERFYPEEPKGIVEPWTEQKLQISRPRYLLGFKHEPRWHGEQLLRQQLTMSLALKLVAGRSSHIYAKLYDADLVSDSFGAGFSSDPNYAYTILGSETDNPEKLHEELVKVLNELKAGGVKSDDVERLKRQMYGSHIASFNSFEYTANRILAHHFNGTDYHRFIEILQSVTAQDVQTTLVQELAWERSSVALLRPVEEHG